MKPLVHVLLVVSVCGLTAAALAQTPLSNVFTYQGRLEDANGPISGEADMIVRMWNDPTSVAPAASLGTEEFNEDDHGPVTLVDGLFTIVLDGAYFGANAFNGENRWLEFAIRNPCCAGGSYVTLTPRQRITATPYARFAAAPWQTNANNLYYGAGNVGIGVVPPDNTLHVHKGSAGSVTADPSSPLVVENSANAYISLLTPNANERGILFGSPSNNAAGGIVYNNNNGAGMQFRTNGNVTRLFLGANGDLELDWPNSNNGTLLGGGLRFGLGSGEGIASKRTAGGNQNGLDFYTGWNARLSITNTGNVGIGTASPERLAHVFAGSAGTVTADISAPLVVESNSNTFMNILSPDNAEKGILFGGPVSQFDGAVRYNNVGTPRGLQFRVNGNVTKMVIDSGGNVGVGTETPSALLHVRGSGAAFGNHLAVFENAGAANADGIAIKINNAHTNRDNNFVTFLNGNNIVTGRIEGFDADNGDWVNPPPPLNFGISIDPGISVRPFNQWFQPGTPPTANSSGGDWPTASCDTVHIPVPPGFDVCNGVTLGGGQFPTVTLSAGTPPAITSSPLTFGQPSVDVTLPSAQEIQAVVAWMTQNGIRATCAIQPWFTAQCYIMNEAERLANDEGVVYASKGADYAEYLEKLDPADRLRFGEVVGVFGGRIARRTDGAERVMVVSRAPAVVGNLPADDELHKFAKVAFMGQVPVLVRGGAQRGDYLVASGLEDGVAIALAESQLNPADLPLVVGRAWEDAADESLCFVNAVIDVSGEAAAAALSRQQRQLMRQADEIAELKRAFAALATERRPAK